jgi:hypothetical protein
VDASFRWHDVGGVVPEPAGAKVFLLLFFSKKEALTF